MLRQVVVLHCRVPPSTKPSVDEMKLAAVGVKVAGPEGVGGVVVIEVFATVVVEEGERSPAALRVPAGDGPPQAVRRATKVDKPRVERARETSRNRI